MAAEEQRIPSIVREIVSSEIDEAATSTNLQISRSNTAVSVNVVGGFQNMTEEFRSRYLMHAKRSNPAKRGPRALMLFCLALWLGYSRQVVLHEKKNYLSVFAHTLVS